MRKNNSNILLWRRATSKAINDFFVEAYGAYHEEKEGLLLISRNQLPADYQWHLSSWEAWHGDSEPILEQMRARSNYRAAQQRLAKANAAVFLAAC